MITIAGATGTCGREIVRQLSFAGIPVRALVRNLDRATAIALPNVELVQGDLNNPDAIDVALEGAEKALLLSSVSPEQMKLQGNFIEAAKRSGTRHIVKFSALGADCRTPTAILNWHGQTQKQLEESNISFTHLQPNIFMQNAFRSVKTIVEEGIFYDRCEAKFSMVDVRDIAAVAVKVLTEQGHENKTYKLTGPEALSYQEVAEKLSVAIGKKVTYVRVLPEEFKRRLLEVGRPEWYADAVNELYHFLSAGQGAVVTKVVAEVAKKQPLSFDRFAQDYAQVFKRRG
jgi:uncharacterized protein YbjT (DUF2867 family)